MTSTRIFQVDSFTSTPFGGNPAGVVPDANGLTVSEMQFAAREMNLSETAFVLSPEAEGADFRVRFFTPGCEVPLCGHATIATFTVLCREGVIVPGTPRVYQQTGAGVLPVDLLWKNNEIESVMMTQASPEFRPFEGDPGEILSALGLSTEDLERSYPAGFASTGLWDLMLPLKGLAAMRKISPNHGELARINRAQGVVSTHVWCLETEETGHDLHVRNLAAAVDIPEDPVTGTANGALGAFLVHNGLVGCTPAVTLTVEQGYEIDRKGLVRVEVAASAGKIERVRVGGTAVAVLSGTMRLS